MLSKPTIQRNINRRAIIYKQKDAIKPASDVLDLSKKNVKSLNLFWYGFLLSMLSIYFATTDDKYIGAAACQALQILGYCCMIISGFSLMKFKFDDKYLENLFRIYFFYSLTIIVRGFQYDFNSLKSAFLNVTYGGVMLYFVPLVVLLPRNIATYKPLYKVILILGAASLVCSIIFYEIIHNEDWMSTESLVYMENLFSLLAFSSGFILLTPIYHSNKKLIFSASVLLISLYFLIFRARRGSMFQSLTTMASAGLVYLIYTKKKGLIIFAAVVLALGTAFFMSGNSTPSMFSHLEQRADEDTRSGVEQYMTVSMKPVDWLIGKGINGSYYCPIVLDVNNPTGNRDVIETGYLQIILKGGIISLGLLLFILLPAIYKGLFKSNNVLSKGAGMFILLWTLYLYPSIGTGFTTHYILLWISVGICYSKKITDIDDEQIKAAFKKK
jgi:hypothetical protein